MTSRKLSPAEIAELDREVIKSLASDLYDLGRIEEEPSKRASTNSLAATIFDALLGFADEDPEAYERYLDSRGLAIPPGLEAARKEGEAPAQTLEAPPEDGAYQPSQPDPDELDEDAGATYVLMRAYNCPEVPYGTILKNPNAAFVGRFGHAQLAPGQLATLRHDGHRVIVAPRWSVED